MSLSEFIRQATERIVSEWEIFARSCTPAADAMNLRQRRDHLVAMLADIAHDLETPQSKDEQKEKSIGNEDESVDADSAANAHGSDRAGNGFTPAQMVSEFRALRASIIRLWSESQEVFSRAHLEEVTRFNESIDQMLAESITRYAEDVDRSKDLFLAVLGHDLRNPLAAIRIWASVMQTSEGPQWPHAKGAASIQTSCVRMDHLIGDLMDFTRSRLGAGMPLARARVDLQAECRHVVDEIAASHPGRVVTMEATGALRGQWDGARIAQALSNLMGNAIQHGSANGPVRVALRGERERVVLTVHNEGDAIPSRYLKDIFDPFRQLTPDQGVPHRASVGLGLYIVQAIASAHHGSIDVASNGGGTTFTLRLPRQSQRTVVPSA